MNKTTKTFTCVNQDCILDSIEYDTDYIVYCDVCHDFENSKTHELLKCFECGEILVFTPLSLKEKLDVADEKQMSEIWSHPSGLISLLGSI